MLCIQDVTRHLVQLLLCVLAAAVFSYTAVAPQFDQPFVSWAFATACVFLYVARPAFGNYLLAVAIGICLTTLYLFFAVKPGADVSPVALYSAMLGRGCLIVLCWRCFWAQGEERKPRFVLAALPIGIVEFVLLVLFLLNVTGRFQPHLYDLYLYVFDGSLGFEPSFVLARWLRGIPFLRDFVQFNYLNLPLVIGMVSAGHLRRGSPLRVLSTLGMAGIVGYVCYFIFPAIGPIYALSNRYPDMPHTLAQLASLPLRPLNVALPVPCNAMPSLHFAWALLLWYNTLPFSSVYRRLAAAYLGLTVLATLALGEHYLIDLVVAVPFALMVQAPWINAPARLKLMTATTGALLTAAWMSILRYDVKVFFISPLLPWFCTLGSTAVCWFVARKALQSERDGHAGAIVQGPENRIALE